METGRERGPNEDTGVKVSQPFSLAPPEHQLPKKAFDGGLPWLRSWWHGWSVPADN